MMEEGEVLVSFISFEEMEQRSRLEARRRAAALAHAERTPEYSAAEAAARSRRTRERYLFAPERKFSRRARRRWCAPVVMVARGRSRCARPRERHAARSSSAGRGSPDDGPGSPEWDAWLEVSAARRRCPFCGYKLTWLGDHWVCPNGSCTEFRS